MRHFHPYSAHNVMGATYRIVRPDGRIEYTDTPNGAGTIDAVTSGGRKPVEQDRSAENLHQQAKDLIKEVQKRAPKLVDYFNYLDYLRHNRPIQFDRVMRELRDNDPRTWLKLQKYPQFRPLRETVLGIKAGTNLMGAGMGLATGNITGSTEKWMENTLKDMMKRDRFGPYAKVLGNKATTLPTTQPTYSNSRLGQFLKTEDARAATAGAKAAAALEDSHAALRAAPPRAVGAVGNVLIDLGIGALKTETFTGISYFRGLHIARKLQEKGILTPDEAYELPRMMARHEYDKIIEMINAGVARAGGTQ